MSKNGPTHALDNFAPCVHGELSSRRNWKEAAKDDLGAKLVRPSLVNLTSKT